MRATVCLPTYDERANVERMLRALAEVVRDGDRGLVIDDSSPDGTGELADELARELPFVSVLHRAQKEGLGPAYLAGFRRALEDGAELVLEMDCDFSHDPKDVPRLVAAVEGGADVALGSRYVRGGSVGNWGLVRRFISRGGSIYAQVLIGTRIRDLTGGFKCYRRAVHAILEQLAEAHEGRVDFVRLNVDEHPSAAARYDVLSIPTVMLFEGGEPRETVIGARPRSYFERAFESWLSGSSAPPAPSA